MFGEGEGGSSGDEEGKGRGAGLDYNDDDLLAEFKPVKDTVNKVTRGTLKHFQFKPQLPNHKLLQFQPQHLQKLLQFQPQYLAQPSLHP